jgi:hypothetical protein
LEPPLFNQAKAEAPPTGFADRGFDSAATFSLPFSPDTVLLTWGGAGALLASLSPLRFPSSKKRDCPVTGEELDADKVRADLEGLNTLMPVSRRW